MPTINEDGGCPTDAPEAALFVNSEGEVLGEEKLIDCSSRDLRVLEETYGFTCEEVIRYPDLPQDRKRAYEAALAAAFPAKRDGELDAHENAFVFKMYAIQGLVGFSRFRAYGELRQDGSECIVVVTEFIGFVEDEALWQRIEEVRCRTEAHRWIMDKRKVREHWRRTDEHGEEIPGSDRYGPDHGKTERQVEFSWRVEDQSPDEIRRLLAELAEQTQEIWDEAGVALC
ncbi:MAG: hypothetical protein KY475_06525 [Planctomycetes bacterium]|nr:hypothetical protein [Planctomycetota bacterium]